jgi:hypothetical protein
MDRIAFSGRARLADVPELFREGIRAALRGEYLKGALLAGEIASVADRYLRMDPIERLKVIGLSEILADYSARSAVFSALGISPEARKWISQKIRLLRREGYGARQAAAIAYAMARRRGFRVPLRGVRYAIPADKIARTVTLVRLIESARRPKKRRS